jgi:hypothetical protein
MSLQKLYDKLKINSKLSSKYDRWNFIELECGQGFEPHGRASETWEVLWILRLPHIRYYWKGTNGWQLSDMAFNMQFKGKTQEDAVNQALKFLDECPNPQELTNEEHSAMRN